MHSQGSTDPATSTDRTIGDYRMRIVSASVMITVVRAQQVKGFDEYRNQPLIK